MMIAAAAAAAAAVYDSSQWPVPEPLFFMGLRLNTLTAHLRRSVSSFLHAQYAIYIFIPLLVTKLYIPRCVLL